MIYVLCFRTGDNDKVSGNTTYDVANNTAEAAVALINTTVNGNNTPKVDAVVEFWE